MNALAEMESQTDCAVNVNNALTEMTKNEDAEIEIQNQIPKYLEDANRILSELYKHMETIDNRAADYAKFFYQQAEAIAQNSHTNDDEAIVNAMTNVCIGMAVQGVGKLVRLAKEGETLHRIKSFLCKEAEEKLPVIQKHGDNVLTILNSYYDEFSKFNGNTENGYALFQKLRLAQHTFNMHVFLKNTYEAAIKGEFYDAVFPSIYQTNQEFIESFINPQKGANTNEKYEYYVQAMQEFIAGITEKTKNNEMLTLKEYIFVKDSLLMSTAIHDYYPLSRNRNFAKLVLDSNGNENKNLTLLSENFYHDFYQLGIIGREREDSPLAQAINDNNALEIFFTHIEQYIKIKKEFFSRKKKYSINVCLLGSLLFLLTFVGEGDWFVAITTSIVGMIIAYVIAPYKVLRTKYHLKLTCVNRTIQTVCLNNAGYQGAINLAKLNAAFTNKIVMTLGCGIVFQFIIPLPIIGFLVGAFIGFLIPREIDDEKDGELYIDYNQVSTGSTWKVKTIFALLVIANLFVFYTVISSFF